MPPGAVAAQAAGPGMTSVYGFATAEGANIAIVDPTPSIAPLTGTRSQMSLELLGEHQRLLARAPLLVTDSHIDPDRSSPGAPLVLFEGAIPQRAAATAIAVVSEGKVLTVDRKPSREPLVRLLAPTPGQQHPRGAGPVVVRWRATNPDGVHLIVSIDFSVNDGRSWRTVYMGNNTGRLSLPRGLTSAALAERGFESASTTASIRSARSPDASGSSSDRP